VSNPEASLPGDDATDGTVHPQDVDVPDDGDADATEEVLEILEDLEADYESVAAERDEYRDALLRVKAEFDNFRKRTERERQAMATQASARLAGELLAVLDSCDAAIAQGAADVEPVRKALVDLLTKEGLEVLPASGVGFDPHLHEAVIHEEGDGTAEGVAEVVETLRTGYLWQGTVLRPAMVRVRG
jgi:molecular chaperone GrpE